MTNIPTDQTGDELDKVLLKVIPPIIAVRVDDQGVHEIDQWAVYRSEIRAGILKYYLSKQEVREALDQLEAQGHGGGDWRRLVIQLRQKLGLEDKA